jgi:hypothetical protein
VSVVVPGLAACVVQEELLTVSAEKPMSLEDVVREPSWWEAMMEELRSIEENGTRETINLPVGH